MMATGQDVIEVAREYLGVRWHHQGRNCVGIDCIGLVFAVAHRLGLSTYHTADYGRLPDGQCLRRLLAEHMDFTIVTQPGDVLLMRIEKQPQHVGIMTDIGIIHAYVQARKVVEHRIDDVWRDRIIAAYAFRGIQ